MEVKDLLKGDKTQKEKDELELSQRKEKYKKTQRYIHTDGFAKLCDYFLDKGEKKFEEIKLELQGRKKTEAVSSELDKIVADIDFYDKLLKRLGTSEGEKVLKEEMRIRKENAESHIYIKVSPEELFDLPVYTKLDMLKLMRRRHITLKQYITNISDSYLVEKEVPSEPDPYKKAPK